MICRPPERSTAEDLEAAKSQSARRSAVCTYTSQSDPDGESLKGRWAHGKAYDGSGTSLTSVNPDKPRGEAPRLAQVDPRSYGTPAAPVPAASK